jgi:hypothetical protein
MISASRFLLRFVAVLGWALGATPAFTFDCVVLRDCGREHEHAPCNFVTTTKVVAQLPDGMRIVQVGGEARFYRPDKLPGDPVSCKDLRQLSHPLSLDKYAWEGRLKIKGSFQAAGRIRYEPNDSGDLFFVPDGMALQSGGRFFRDRFSVIKLDGLGLTRITPPRNLSRADCWEAKATLKMTDFEIGEEGSSKSGTYPGKARLVSSSRSFKRCQWGMLLDVAPIALAPHAAPPSSFLLPGQQSGSH